MCFRPKTVALGISKPKGQPVGGVGAVIRDAPQVPDPAELLARGLARVPDLGLPIPGGRVSTPAKGRRSR